MALTQQQCDALTAKITRRVANLAGSATVAAADKARRLKAEGRSIVDLSGGDPDFRTAPHVTEVAIAALDRGNTHYTPSRGIPELLKAIAHKLASENGLGYDPAKEILALPGGKQAIFIAAQALLDPGDEMIIFTPAWVSYGPVRHAGRGADGGRAHGCGDDSRRVEGQPGARHHPAYQAGDPEHAEQPHGPGLDRASSSRFWPTPHRHTISSCWPTKSTRSSSMMAVSTSPSAACPACSNAP